MNMTMIYTTNPEATLPANPPKGRPLPTRDQFVPIDRRPDTSRNAMRGTPRPRKNRTIL